MWWADGHLHNAAFMFVRQPATNTACTGSFWRAFTDTLAAGQSSWVYEWMFVTLLSVVVNPMIEKSYQNNCRKCQRFTKNNSGPPSGNHERQYKTLCSSPSFGCWNASVWVPVTCSHAFRKSVASCVETVLAKSRRCKDGEGLELLLHKPYYDWLWLKFSPNAAVLSGKRASSSFGLRALLIFIIIHIFSPVKQVENTFCTFCWLGGGLWSRYGNWIRSCVHRLRRSIQAVTFSNVTQQISRSHLPLLNHKMTMFRYHEGCILSISICNRRANKELCASLFLLCTS